MSNEILELQEGINWDRGLGNLINIEKKNWFKSWKWWGQTLWILFMTNAILIAICVDDPDNAANIFSIFQCLYPTLGILALMQNSIIGEKINGTAEWILSKPVSRSAYILSKLVVNTIGGTFFMLLIPGVLGYFELTQIAGLEISFGKFLLGNIALWIHFMFYVSFALIIGTISKKARSVFLAGILFLMIQSFMGGILPAGIQIASIGFPITDGVSPIAVAIMIGQPIFSIWPIIIALMLIIVFILLSIYKYQKEEF